MVIRWLFDSYFAGYLVVANNSFFVAIAVYCRVALQVITWVNFAYEIITLSKNMVSTAIPTIFTIIFIYISIPLPLISIFGYL